jgi:hypothetical protein
MKAVVYKLGAPKLNAAFPKTLMIGVPPVVEGTTHRSVKIKETGA